MRYQGVLSDQHTLPIVVSDKLNWSEGRAVSGMNDILFILGVFTS